MITQENYDRYIRNQLEAKAEEVKDLESTPYLNDDVWRLHCRSCGTGYQSPKNLTPKLLKQHLKRNGWSDKPDGRWRCSRCKV